MKYKLIKESDKIKLISGKDIVVYSGFGKPVKKGETPVAVPDVVRERDIIKTKIFTDGKIKGIETLTNSKLELPKNMKTIELDKVEVNELELTDHKFIIKILTALEFQKRGKVFGWFDVIKDVEVYLRDRKDKDSIKKIKKTLELVCSNQEYTSIFEFLFSKNQTQTSVIYNQEKEGIYQLVKTK